VLKGTCSIDTSQRNSPYGLILFWSTNCLLKMDIAGRGVATGWTGVDMSTPLLPEVVPELDWCNSGEFLLGRRGGWRVGRGLELDSPFASVR